MFPKGIFISPMLTYVCIHFTIGITEETKFIFLIHIQQEKRKMPALEDERSFAVTKPVKWPLG